ncbi:MAG: response regulator transcription factor, partial [Halobacteriota archaeon]
SDGQRPDFVLMDLRMPVMDGVEATKKILESDPEANIYLFTAYAGTEEESDALKAGAKGTISKAADWHGTVENIINLTDKL